MMQHAEMSDWLVTPCPTCGGRVRFMNMFDHPPMLGGNYEYDFCLCSQCGQEWLEAECPPNFFSPDGQYWNTERAAAANFYPREGQEQS